MVRRSTETSPRFRKRFGFSFYRRGSQLPRSMIGALYTLGRHDEARALLLRVIYETSGRAERAAETLGLGLTRYKTYVVRLGLMGEPAKARARLKVRFRLPQFRGI